MNSGKPWDTVGRGGSRWSESQVKRCINKGINTLLFFVTDTHKNKLLNKKPKYLFIKNKYYIYNLLNQIFVLKGKKPEPHCRKRFMVIDLNHCWIFPHILRHEISFSPWEIWFTLSRKPEPTLIDVITVITYLISIVCLLNVCHFLKIVIIYYLNKKLLNRKHGHGQ
jgi:hypothetical protein